MFEETQFPQLSAGQQINQYILKERIGTGGMGIVWSAEQISMQRLVAIKFLPDVESNPETEARFEREVKMISQLEHPHILPVYAYGQEFGAPYIVMRYMPGGTVIDRLNKRDLTLKLALDIIAQIAGALDYAHDQEIIHRDVKPSNIFLDEQSYAYLADFGLAKSMSGDYDLTRTDDGISGTPDYMSPEQVRGIKLDGRADIYSLGVIGFQLLTGRLPYMGKSPMDTVMMHINAPIPSLFHLVPQLPPEADPIFQKVLAKKVSDRYESGKAFSNDLVNVFRGQDTEINLRDIGRFAGPIESAETRLGTGEPPTQPTPPDRRPDPLQVAPVTTADSAAGRGGTPPLMVWFLGMASILTVIFLIFIGWLFLYNPLSNVLLESYGEVRHPFDLAYDAARDRLWVADQDENRVQQIVANCFVNQDRCGTVEATIDVAPLPERIAVGQNQLLVRHEVSSSISTISLDDNSVALLQIKEIPINFVTVGDNIWIVTAGGELLEVQPDGHILFRETAGSVLRSMVLLNETIWIADEEAGQIKAFELAAKAFNPTRAIFLDQPQFISLYADTETNRLFIGAGKENQVLIWDEAVGRMIQTIGTGQRPIDLWYFSDLVWVLNQTDRNVQVFNPDNGRELGRIQFEDRPEAGVIVPCGPSCGEFWIGFEKDATPNLGRYDLTQHLVSIKRLTIIP